MKNVRESAIFRFAPASTNMKVLPLFDNVLIEPLEADVRTSSGIILPDSAQEKPQMGKVMAVGKGKTDKDGKFIAIVVAVGDTVMYKKWGGNEVKVDGKDMTLVGQEDILAIVEKTEMELARELAKQHSKTK